MITARYRGYVASWLNLFFILGSLSISGKPKVLACTSRHISSIKNIAISIVQTKKNTNPIAITLFYYIVF